jgi:hypothetical protein
VEAPFLKRYALSSPSAHRHHADTYRNLEAIPEAAQTDEFHGDEGLSLKIALGSYRMFFLPETEDYFYRTRQSGDIEALRAKEDKYAAAAKKRMDEKYATPPAADQSAGKATAAT